MSDLEEQLAEAEDKVKALVKLEDDLEEERSKHRIDVKELEGMLG